MKKKYLTTFRIAVACVFCLLLHACSDNKGKDAPPPKVTSQTESPQDAASQAPPSASTPAMKQSTAADGGKCAALLTAKCTECHNTTRICEKLGKKSNSRWQRTISRMTERGAKVSAEEAAELLLCLDSGAKNLESTCR